MNEEPFDIWTIPHVGIGVALSAMNVNLFTSLWIALGIEAIEIAVSEDYPQLGRESRSNQLGDLAAFAVGYALGGQFKKGDGE